MLQQRKEQTKRNFEKLVKENANIGNVIVRLSTNDLKFNPEIESGKLCNLYEDSFERIWDSIGTYHLGEKYIIDTNFNAHIQKIALIKFNSGYLEITKGVRGIGSNAAEDISGIYYHSQRPRTEDFQLNTQGPEENLSKIQ